MSITSITIPGYELVRELGAGGMANVYLAIQRSLDRKIALKVMKRNIDDADKFEKRFLVEGRTMAKLPHRNIVAVYDIVKGEDATYIAMEYLEGGTLSQKMKDGLSLAEAISVIAQIAQALQFAHEHGIVHRDLKPANIMFRDPSTPVLTDFGIAKQQDATATRLTQTGMLVGTPTYMSPEQINALEVDGRSDLYSLGVLFYEMLTGSPPFLADTPIAVLMAHLTTPPPPLPPAFADFQHVIDHSLAKNRDERFANLKEFVRALKAAVVNNQNLWARLQADPNQSSSEQLRALGFSVSGGENLQIPITGQVRLPPSGRGQPRTPTPSSIDLARQNTPTGLHAPPARTFPWLWVGIGAGAFVVLFGLFLLFKPAGELDPTTQKLVDAALSTVRGELQRGDLDRARELLQPANDMAPKYSGTAAVRKEVLDAYRQRIEAALQKQDTATATALLLKARLVDADDAQLAALLDRVDQQRRQAEKNAALADLFQRADAAARAGRDLVPGGAYELLVQAREGAPDSADVKQRLDALLDRVLKPGRDALARNDVAGAQAVVRQTEGVLANEPAWQVLHANVDAATARAEQRARLATVLATIDRQIAGGQLDQPRGDNAQETLARAIAASASDPEVLRRQQALAQALTARAQQAFNAGRIERALADANVALNVQPDFAAALALKRGAEGRIDQNRARVIDALGDAQQALAEARILTPPGDNARELLDAVLKLDPANADAKRLIEELPARAVEAARARLASNDLDGAKALVDEGRRRYPTDAALVALAGDIAQRAAQAQQLAERTKQFERITQLVAARPLRAENVGSASTEIARMLAANPLDVDAATAKQRLFAAIGDALTGAATPADLDAIDAALARAGAAFANDAALAKLVADAQAARTRVAAAEQERLAALAGELVVNAYPWATVESIVDANRKTVALPADATTPLRLSLPAGVYTITFRHPQVSRAATQVAQVQPRKSVTANVSFAATINGKDYLQRAGF